MSFALQARNHRDLVAYRRISPGLVPAHGRPGAGFRRYQPPISFALKVSNYGHLVEAALGCARLAEGAEAACSRLEAPPARDKQRPGGEGL